MIGRVFVSAGRFSRFHRNDLVGAGFMVAVGHLQKQLILLDLELSFAADGQERRMLGIGGADVVLELIGTKEILGT